jgi:hypothetical protein
MVREPWRQRVEATPVAALECRARGEKVRVALSGGGDGQTAAKEAEGKHAGTEGSAHNAYCPRRGPPRATFVAPFGGQGTPSAHRRVPSRC